MKFGKDEMGNKIADDKKSFNREKIYNLRKPSKKEEIVCRVGICLWFHSPGKTPNITKQREKYNT